ncbi:SPAC56F8.03 [Ecytonucleospora hepatopenaei]|uniref:Eukaryotic translation initiation factor 5B n=1 Tax=Ecytonucleospora hepatopenaei TaxID=646526 RepID=A0A1W0E8G4_9MICR|nr:SPAC56F8.03 [Ecytonucleospora hepatopenaei]
MIDKRTLSSRNKPKTKKSSETVKKIESKDSPTETNINENLLQNKKTVVSTTSVINSTTGKKGGINLAALRKQQAQKAEDDKKIFEAKKKAEEEYKVRLAEAEKKLKEKEEKERFEKEEKEKIKIVQKKLARTGIFGISKKPEETKTPSIPEEKPTLTKQIKKERISSYKSPICCILGHVDTGKTKLLDKLRESNVQGNEAGGITQQIGATFFPTEMLNEKCHRTLHEEILSSLPGILVIDTPGHESFSNLRSRGSSLCDLAILVVDICHALEPQTIESIQLLKNKKTPFIVALNKIDRVYGWKNNENGFFDFENQDDYTKREFEKMVDSVVVSFAEQGLNACLFDKNQNIKKNVSMVPTSAITGEGIPNLVKLFLELSHRFMLEKMKITKQTECTILEVKHTEGFGLTLDAILSNGTLREGDKIALNGFDGVIHATIRTILVPQPLKELRIKSAYQTVKAVTAAMGIKVVIYSKEHDISNAVAGSKMYVIGTSRGIELKTAENLLKEDFSTVMNQIETVDEGVHIVANTLGAMEALLKFLKDSDVPVCSISLGKIRKKDIMKMSMVNKKYRFILSFDVHFESKELIDLCKEYNIQYSVAPIIYHLLDFYKEKSEQMMRADKEKYEDVAIFPSKIKIVPNCVFCSRSPLVLGVEVIQGTLKINTPLCVFKKDIKNNSTYTLLGKVTSIEEKKQKVNVLEQGKQAAIKVEVDKNDTAKVLDRHFTVEDEIYSVVTRKSIDLLKEFYKDDLTQEHIELLFYLKKKFDII